jgi:hypothetical protein
VVLPRSPSPKKKKSGFIKEPLTFMEGVKMSAESDGRWRGQGFFCPFYWQKGSGCLVILMADDEEWFYQGAPSMLWKERGCQLSLIADGKDRFFLSFPLAEREWLSGHVID